MGRGGNSHGSQEEGDNSLQEKQGALLYVSIKMENTTNSTGLTRDIFPHVYGSSFPLVSSWDPSKAVILIHTHFSISVFPLWVGLGSSFYC